jgi:hypothetical protein
VLPGLSTASEALEAEVEIGAFSALDSKSGDVLLAVVAVESQVEILFGFYLVGNLGWKLQRHAGVKNWKISPTRNFNSKDKQRNLTNVSSVVLLCVPTIGIWHLAGKLAKTPSHSTFHRCLKMAVPKTA